HHPTRASCERTGKPHGETAYERAKTKEAKTTGIGKIRNIGTSDFHPQTKKTNQRRFIASRAPSKTGETQTCWCLTGFDRRPSSSGYNTAAIRYQRSTDSSTN